jgi:hypothetical protein
MHMPKKLNLIEHISSKKKKQFLSLIVCSGLMLSIVPLLVQIQASPSMPGAGRETGLCTGTVSQLQEDQPARQLEPGKPIERELTGGVSHSYQLTLDAGQPEPIKAGAEMTTAC